MTLSSRLTVACALALIPFAVAVAAAPGNVTGIRGEMRDGKAVVSWQKPAGEEPVAYRVFYSRESILEQGGVYDDFDTVNAPSTEYAFTSIPFPTDVLYVAVLAMSASGEESALFTEEARIQLNGPAPSQPTQSSSAVSSRAIVEATTSSAASVSSAMQEATILQVLKAEAVSATGSMVTFNLQITVDQARAADAFEISDASGAKLAIRRLTITGNQILVQTEPQVRGKIYRLTVSDAVSGKDSQGRTIALDPEQAPVLFAGSEKGIDPSLAGTSSSVPAQPSSAFTGPSLIAENVRGLTVRGQAQQDGTYTVEISWQPVSNPTAVREFRIAQSRDRGMTFGSEQIISPVTNGIRITRVPAGEFGIRVQVGYVNGMVSNGVFQSIRLGGGSTLPGNVLEQPKTGTKLPQTGIEVLIPLMMAGGGVGMHMVRRRKMGSMEA